MEKFARHALVDGVTDVERLSVGRESELFRALSMHYNKASDFQVTAYIFSPTLVHVTF